MYTVDKLIGKLVVVSHWSDAKLEDATKLGILYKVEDSYFYIDGDNRGYKYCRKVSQRPLRIETTVL